MRDHLGEFCRNDETRRGACAPIPYHRSGGSSIERRVYLNGVKVFRIFRDEFSSSGVRRIENPYPILTGPARGAKAQVLNLRVIQRSQISYCKSIQRRWPSYSPHMPRSRAPHVLHGPASKEAAECEPFATANTESNLSTLGLSHFLQCTPSDEEVMIFSNWAPQSWHLYSKIGISLSLSQYSG